MGTHRTLLCEYRRWVLTVPCCVSTAGGSGYPCGHRRWVGLFDGPLSVKERMHELHAINERYGGGDEYGVLGQLGMPTSLSTKSAADAEAEIASAKLDRYGGFTCALYGVRCVTHSVLHCTTDHIGERGVACCVVGCMRCCLLCHQLYFMLC